MASWHLPHKWVWHIAKGKAEKANDAKMAPFILLEFE